MSDALKPMMLDVEKFSRFSSTTFKADKFYKTIGYGCGSLGHLLSLYARSDSDVSTGFKALSSNIGMARFVVRFTGSFEAYNAWKNGAWCYGDDSATVKRLVSLQALSMLAYYPMEHLSYVGFVAPKLLNFDAGKVSRRSCLAWTLYVILDIYANYLRIKALSAKAKALAKQTDISDDEVRMQDQCYWLRIEPQVTDSNGFLSVNEAKLGARDYQQSVATPCSLVPQLCDANVASNGTFPMPFYRKRELYFVQLRNACFFPTCLHWSLEKGLIPESLVQFLCFTEASLGIWRTWVNSS